MFPPSFKDEDEDGLPNEVEHAQEQERILISVAADDLLWRKIHEVVEMILFKGACLIRSNLEDAIMHMVDAHYDSGETLSRQQLKENLLHAIELVYKNL